MSSFEEQFQLSTEDIEQGLWVHDGTHLGFAMTPLFQSFQLPAIEDAMAAIGRVSSARTRIYHGYAYNEQVGPAPHQGPPKEALLAMRSRFATVREDFERTVQVDLLPAYQALDDLSQALQNTADAIRALQRLVTLYSMVWTRHMEIVMPVFAAQELYEAVFLELFADKRAADAHALLVGATNQFTETDRALAALADTARECPDIVQALHAPDPWEALQGLSMAGSFRADLSQVLERYGWRVGSGRDFYQKTWQEDPRPALAIVRQLLDHPESFEDRFQRILADQKEALAAVLNQLEPEGLARFQEAFGAAWAARPIDEDHHFYIDAMLPARARPLLRKIGAVLVRSGYLASADDVFFLYRDEVEAMLRGQPSVDGDTTANRRRQYERWYQETPPPTLGRSDHVMDEGVTAASDAVIIGISASLGRRQGIVRVIQGPEDFGRLEPGDVLVARTTTPSWSGLFATAGAVVTDSGGILSHAATVAREYRVPCVVAARGATTRLQDGDLVLVDGDQGTVTVMARRGLTD